MRTFHFALRAAVLGVAPLLGWTPAASAGGDVKINADVPGTVQNEVRIAVGQPVTDMIVVYNDRVGTPPSSPLGVSYSADGGVSWIDTQLTIPPDPFSGGSFLTEIFDPYCNFGQGSDWYAGYIATTASGAGTSGLFIERSTNAGVAWSGPTTIALDAPAAGAMDPNYRFNDRPTMDVDPVGQVNVVWIKDVGNGAFSPPPSDVYYTYSPPAAGGGMFPPTGLNFTLPVTVNDTPNGTDLANVPHVIAHPGGRVYVAWIDLDVSQCDASSATILLDSTTIPPMPVPVFGTDQTVVSIDPLPRFLNDGMGVFDARAGSYPVIAVDENDPTQNTVYIAYAADPAGADEGDIFFTKSIDAGANWSTPIRVNDDTTTNDQFHPVIFASFGSLLTIAWYDKRNSANDDTWDVYMAQSTNGGNSFHLNHRVSDASFPTPTAAISGVRICASPNPIFAPWLGEYMGLDFDGNDFVLAFTKRVADANGDVYFDRVASCGLDAITYCTSKTSSAGCIPFLSRAGLGQPSVTDTNAFTIRSNDHVVGQGGVLVYGFKKANLGFHGGKLCVKSPIRTPAKVAKTKASAACTAISSTGRLSSNFNQRIGSGVDPMLTVGQTVFAQWQQRDPANTLGGFADNLSDAMRFTICP